MSFGKYILNDAGNPQLEPDLIKWATWFETANRRVSETMIGEVRVSTLFLGLDHSFPKFGEVPVPPVFWETMVFGGELDHEMNRCGGSKEQAEAMHSEMVDRVKAVELLKPVKDRDLS